MELDREKGEESEAALFLVIAAIRHESTLALPFFRLA